MNVLVVGSGGREHAIVWKLAQSPRVKKLYCAPGNGGISDLAECLPVDALDKEGMVRAAREKNIDLVVVAPDDPLAKGMARMLSDKCRHPCFRSVEKAALIESSKAFSKDLMKKYGIPTAEYALFNESGKALDYLKNHKYPLVVKADGLALGKGVIICNTLEEAEEAVISIMEQKKFGEAGSQVVIEEFITGPEVSILAFTDGKTIVPMVSSQDHKRALDGDKGLNTGGMGTFTPSRIYTPEIADYCMQHIYLPTVEAMNKEGRTFKGVLYFGLMLTADGPKLMDYNRFGYPESQVVLPRLNNDLLDVFEAVIDEKLNSIHIEWTDTACVCVMLASGGYPESYRKGFEITGLEQLQDEPDIIVFHSGTKKENGRYYTNGGRVLGVTAVEKDFDKAREKAYQAVSRIYFEGITIEKILELNNSKFMTKKNTLGGF